jgi:hypothetical protein
MNGISSQRIKKKKNSERTVPKLLIVSYKKEKPHTNT